MTDATARGRTRSVPEREADGGVVLAGVHVRWRTGTIQAADPRPLLDVMGAAQRRRFDLLAPDAAARFAAGRRLIGELARELAGPDVGLALDSPCLRCGADHGAPVLRVAPVVVSVSHAGSLVVVAAAHRRRASTVGVDVEQRSPRRPMSDLASLFAPHPVPDVAGWTRIEAALKADGRGLRVSPSEVMLHRTAAGWAAVIPGREAPVEVVSVTGPSGHALSIAVVPAG